MSIFIRLQDREARSWRPVNGMDQDREEIQKLLLVAKTTELHAQLSRA